MSPSASHHLVVVPHTHWDREWYRTHEDFRHRLVRLLDRLLDLLEGDPDYRHFTLDGQAIVLDDYLEVRPGARERIAKLVREGRLLVGPWYVLPDEWLVSGEALVRNLRLGLRRASEFGGAMGLGYVPDQFGHVGQLPQIFAGFGLEAAALWRGVGADVDETLFEWEAPDGTRLFSVYLMHGYGNAVHLPLEAEALARRLEQEAESLGRHSCVPTLLLMNGSDHVEPQAGLPAALEAAFERLPGLTGEIGTLPGFVARVREQAPTDLPRHRGELRSGLRSPLLEGCASARLRQKQADVRNDRVLTRYLEPLATWLEALGGDADAEYLDLVWRVALENHPHDSICGCSIDAVHEQMEGRFARVEQMASAHLRRVTRELGRRVKAPRGSLAVWNPGAAGAALAEGELELDAGTGRRAPALHLRSPDGSGRRIPVHAEVREPGALVAQYAMDAAGAALVVSGFPPEFTGLFAVDVRWRRRGERLAVDVWLGVEPEPEFDLAAAKDAFLTALRTSGVDAVDFRVRRRALVALRFADEFPGCGLRVYRLVRGSAGATGPETSLLSDGGVRIANAHWRVDVAADGRVDLRHFATGCEVRDALRVVDDGDRGDEYNFDPVPGGVCVERPARVRVRLRNADESEAAVAIESVYRVPAALGRARDRRASRLVNLPVTIGIRLAADLDRLDLDLSLDNTARDHRLRLHLRAPFEASRFEVESAFEIAERPIAPAPDAFGSDRPSEIPVGLTPQRGFASLCAGDLALTLANRGAPEVEAVPEEGDTTSLAVTLLRAVGWLSREDLALRPGHAGPPVATPGAQVPGAHRCELSLRLHAMGDPTRTAEAHRFAAPPRVFAAGGDGPLADGARLLEVDDPAVVVSAIEPRPGSAPQLRIWSAEPGERRLSVRWNAPGARGLEAVDLAGRVRAGVATEPVALRSAEILNLRPR